jgi:tRNA A-37 threonylcarbamoyl transferase component Bud32
VLGPGAPDWFALDTAPRAECIKTNRHRKVWRLWHDGQFLYVKYYHNSSPGERIKNLWRGSSAMVEWRAGLYAAELELPSVVPLAIAQPTRVASGSPCVLITRGVQRVVPLDEDWTSIRHDRRAVRELIDRLAATIARAHQGGFEHFDLHVGNLLVQREPGARPRVLIVDLHSLRTGQPVDDAAVVRNIAQLNQWFRRHASLTERVRFLNRYLQWRIELAAEMPHARPLGFDLRSMVAALNPAAEKHARTLWSKRDRRTQRDGKYFATVRLPRGWRGHAFLEAKHAVEGAPSTTCRFAAADWHRWLAALVSDESLNRPAGLIKRSHSAHVSRVTLPEALGNIDVIVKRSLPRTAWRQLRNAFRASRDFRSWQRGYALLNRDLPTARPLSVLERRFLGLRLDSLVVTEVIRDSVDLETLVARDLPAMPPCKQRQTKDALIRQLVRLIKQLHERGFAHRDFKAPNVLIAGLDDGPDAIRPWLIDLDGLRLRRQVSDRDRLRVLMRLSVSTEYCAAVTRTDRLRFLKAWMRGPGRTDTAWKPIWRQLAAWSDRKRHQRAVRTEWKLKHYGRP